MVAHDDDAFVAESRRQALPFGSIVGDAAEPKIKAELTKEASRVLVNRLHIGVFEAGQRRRVRRVAMQHDSDFWAPTVHRAVDRPRGRIWSVRPRHYPAVIRIENHEITCPNLPEMPPARVHEECLPVGRNCSTEMISHGLMPIEPSCQTKGRSEINPERLCFYSSQFGRVGVSVHGLSLVKLCLCCDRKPAVP